MKFYLTFVLCVWISLAIGIYSQVSGSEYETVGCFVDDSDRAIATLEGLDAVLDGDYGTRADAINKCAQAAESQGFRMFAVQHGGWCASSATAEDTYDKYGPSSECNDDGKGGPWANQVYYIFLELACLNGGTCVTIPIPGGKRICGGACHCPAEYIGFLCSFRLEDSKMQMSIDHAGGTAHPACQYPGHRTLIDVPCPSEGDLW